MSTKSAITLRDLAFEWPDGTIALASMDFGEPGTRSSSLTGTAQPRLRRGVRKNAARIPNGSVAKIGGSQR